MTEEQIRGLYQSLQDKYVDISIDETLTQFISTFFASEYESVMVKWKKKYDLGFWQFDVFLKFSNEALREDNYLLNGKRQIRMDIGMGGELLPKVKEKALEFVPILCTICENLDPFFAFGSHECTYEGEWIDEYSVRSVDGLIERLHENMGDWTIFYLDAELYNSIPLEYLKVWTAFDFQCGGKGHLISCFSNPFGHHWDSYGRKERRMKEVFNEWVLPEIRKRILREYSLD